MYFSPEKMSEVDHLFVGINRNDWNERFQVIMTT